MYEAYNNKKDLYAMIAQSAYDNEYWENLEFYPEGTEVEIDGKKIIAGNGQIYEKETDEDDSIEVPSYYLVETPTGDIPASLLKIGDKVKSDIGDLVIKYITINENLIKLSLISAN